MYDKIAKNVPGIDELSYVDNSEFVKIDGSLTCRSVLCGMIPTKIKNNKLKCSCIACIYGIKI